MTTANASIDLLAAYADGSLSEGMSLLVASHLTYSAMSRRRVARFEAIGGALLSEAEAVPPSVNCLAGALDRIRSDAGEPDPTDKPRAESQTSILPAPLRQRIGVDAGDIRWRFLLPGLSEYRLDGFNGEEVSLLSARPGVRILQHTHVGEEATLVLSGQLRDGDRVFGAGELALADATDEHHPEIIGSEVCICLVVLSGRMRFTGPVGRALNLFKA